ncbi:MAG: glycerol-3-phosphate dehydrogenase/oxidase [Ferruginibacter sp.]
MIKNLSAILPHRNNALEKLAAENNTWDIVVIGGGASGLGTALDAACRGYKVLLLEQHDFAKGTSSRSTKLVHGGVRYLAQGNIKLVREASVERGLLYKNAAHLVKNQSFLVPVYNYFDALQYTVGLKLYDWIAGTLSMGASRFVSAKKAKEKLPGIYHKNLKGAIEYHDGQFDDARLAINLVQSIWENAGYAFNYIKVTGLQKNEQGKIAAVSAFDTETGRCFSFKTKSVVNATGVFADEILQMDQPGSSKTVCVSQGIHLVVDKKFHPSAEALMIPKTSDGRVLFAVPWHGKVVIGTTDTAVETASLEPVALKKEIDFILETTGEYLVHKPAAADILSVFAGQRPLAAPKEGSQKTKEISRSHKIVVSASNLFTMLGGKWTTYRKMAEDMLDKIEENMQWPRIKSATKNLSIHGNMQPKDNDAFYFYGTDAAFLQMDEQGWISKKLHIHRYQIEWAVKNEMCRTVEDFLARRTRALILDAKESMRIAPEVATIMSGLLNEDANWIKKQVDSYNEVAGKYIFRS